MDELWPVFLGLGALLVIGGVMAYWVPRIREIVIRRQEG